MQASEIPLIFTLDFVRKGKHELVSRHPLPYCDTCSMFTLWEGSYRSLGVRLSGAVFAHVVRVTPVISAILSFAESNKDCAPAKASAHYRDKLASILASFRHCINALPSIDGSRPIACSYTRDLCELREASSPPDSSSTQRFPLGSRWCWTSPPTPGPISHRKKKTAHAFVHTFMFFLKHSFFPPKR